MDGGNEEIKVPSMEGLNIDILLAGAAAEAAKLGTVNNAILKELRKARRGRIWFIAGMGFILAALVGLGITTRQQSHIIRAQVDLSKKADGQREQITTVLNEIRSCTTPAGACAQRGAASQGQAVADINEANRRVVIAAVACLRAETDREFTDCLLKIK